MYKVVVNSAHFMKSFPLKALSVSIQYFVGMLQACRILKVHMNEFGAEFFIPRQSWRDIVLRVVRPFRPSTLFVCPEPYLSTY